MPLHFPWCLSLLYLSRSTPKATQMSSRARSQKGERRYTEPAVGKLGVMKRQWVVNRWWTVAEGPPCVVHVPHASSKLDRATRPHADRLAQLVRREAMRGGSVGSARPWQL